MAKRIDAILSLKDNFSSALKKAENNLKSFDVKAKAIGDSMYQTSKGLDAMAGKFMPITLGAVGATAGSIKAFGEYETALKGVQKTTDMSGDKLEAFSDEIVSMTRRIPVSATEIAGVAEAAGQLGISQEGLLDFTETMVMMGTATNMASEEAATTLARFANITQMSEEDYGRLGSTIVTLGNNMATTESEISDMALRLAATGSQVGMTESDIVALSGTLSSLGIEAAAGGTAMSTVMTKVNKAVGEGGENLNKFASLAGVSADEFASAWSKNPAKAMAMLTEGMGKAQKSGENLDVILEDLGITGIREADTMKRLAGSGSMLAKALDMSSTAWTENKALANEAKIAYESFESKFKHFRSALFEVGQVIAKHVMPALEPFLEKATDLAYRFADADEETQKFILKIGAIAAAIGPGLKILSMLTGGIGQVFDKFAKVGQSLKAGKSLFMALNGPGLAVVGVLLALAGAGFLVYKNWDKICEAVERVKGKFSSFSGSLEPLKETIVSLVEKAKARIGDLIGSLSENFEKIKEKLSSFGDAFAGLINVLEPVISFLVEIFGTAFAGAIYGSFVLVIKGVQLFGDMVSSIFGFLIDRSTAVINFFTGVFTGDWDMVFQSLYDLAKAPIDLIVGLWEALCDLLGIDPEPVVSLIYDAFEKGVKWVKDKWEGLKNFFAHPIQGVVNIAKRVSSNIGRNARGTDNWRGGPTWVGEEGPEIVELPRGSRVHTATSSRMMEREAQASTRGSVTVNISKFADEMIIRDESDIKKLSDQVARELIRKIRNTSPSMA